MHVVDGTVAPRFETVRSAFADSDLGRGGGSFAAYVDGELVADLWAGDAAPGVPWSKDTMTVAFSATKGAAAMCLLVLHSRGLIDVDAPVTQYWPEYGQAGKERTLVRHFLNHTSGLLCFDDPGSVLDWEGNGWDDYDAIARGVERTASAWEPGTKIAYHGVSYGWLCQELVRRVTGMTLGRFFDQEIAQPLGLSIFIGTPESEQLRLAQTFHDSLDSDVPEMQALVERFKALLHDPSLLLARSTVLMHGESMYENMSFVDLPRVRSAEIPAVNGSMDARSLARMYAVLAEGGTLDGVNLASPASIALFGTKSFSGPSALWEGIPVPPGIGSSDMRYALGFEGDFGETEKPWRFGPTPEAFGHLGAGGQIGFADPERRVSVGFLRNHGSDWSVSTTLVEALYKCL